RATLACRGRPFAGLVAGRTRQPDSIPAQRGRCRTPADQTLELAQRGPVQDRLDLGRRRTGRLQRDALLFLTSRIADPELQHEPVRSEEHTSELQSRENLVCRLLLEKKKKMDTNQLNHVGN